MSAVLEPQAAEVEVIDRAEIKDGHALVAYSRTEAGLMALKADLAGKVYDLATVKGNELARQDRQRCVSLRTALDKKRLEFKRPVLDIGKQIDTEAKRITDEILKLEAPIDAAIKADEERREKIRLEKAAAEAARQQVHRDGIAKIRAYADAARRPDMTAERLLKGLSALEGMTIDPAAWEEFATEAAHVLGETITAVKAEHAAMVAKEAEAARLEFQRQEQDRIAAEQAEAQRKLDEQAAALRAQQEAQAAELAAKQAEISRQAEALAEQKRAADAAEAKRLKGEQDRAAEAAFAALREAEKAEAIEPERAQRIGCLIAAVVADAVIADAASIPVGEVLESVEPAAVPGLADDGKRWKLGDIKALFGIVLTAEFVRSLGIEPVATERGAQLFTTLQVIELRTALVAHLMSLEIEYPA